MTAKSVLLRPQGLRPRARAPTCPPLLRHWVREHLLPEQQTESRKLQSSSK